MSWYNNQFGELKKRWFQGQNIRPACDVTMTLVIPDMFTQADGVRLVQILEGLRGIKDVKAQPERRKLSVIFETPTTDLQAITLEINRAGYHNLQKA